MSTISLPNIHKHLFDIVAPIVSQAAQWFGVRAAYVRRDGRDFILAGDGWSPELSMRAAELSVALQYSLFPSFTILIEGGYEPFRGTPPGEYQCIYENG